MIAVRLIVCTFSRTWRHRCVSESVQSFRLWTCRSCSTVAGHINNNNNNNQHKDMRIMEEMLRRTVVPLPNYETRDKSPPPPDSNSLDFMHFYRNLGKEQRLVFLEILSREYGVDHRGASEMARKLVDIQSRDLATILQAEDRLRYSLTPRYKHLLSHVSKVEGGVKFLVDLRAEVLDFTSKVTDSPHLRVNSSLCTDLTFNTTLTVEVFYTEMTLGGVWKSSEVPESVYITAPVPLHPLQPLVSCFMSMTSDTAWLLPYFSSESSALSFSVALLHNKTCIVAYCVWLVIKTLVY